MKLFSNLLFVTLISLQVQAMRLDIQTHDTVIQRLEESLRGVQDGATATSIHIRLADLYADRARLKSIEEVSAKCNDCHKSKSDRNKAIAHYELARREASQDQLKRIVLQTAHLYTMNGQPEEAKKLFSSIISGRTKSSSELTGESHAGLGELLFREGKFSQAKDQFLKALTYKIEKEAYVRYRLAWCFFNEGKSSTSIALLKKNLDKKQGVSESLRKDMARDLFTFSAREKLTKSSVHSLLSLTPPSERKTNLFFLGQEADRLGNKDGALLVWSIYSNYEDVPLQESLEIQIRTAQAYFDQGRKAEALSTYSNFNKSLAKYNCASKEICEELRARSRNFVLTWIKREKSAPSTTLSSALKNYVEFNKDDAELVQWAGHVARFNKQMVDASGYYRNAADLSAQQLKKSKDKTAREQLEKILNSSLLAEIECAEESKNRKTMRSAYNHYLAIYPNGPKKDEVTYQLTYIDYEEKKYKKTAVDFDRLATKSQQLSRELKIKAADLALDSLAFVKADKEIKEHALRYSSLFAEKRTEYLSISRKASVQMAVKLFDNGKASNSNAKKSLKELQSVSLAGTSADEKISILKNRIIVAEKIKDLNTVDSSAAALLAIPTISASDREYALSRRLQAAEAHLNFKQAFWYAQQMNFPKVSRHEKALKLALLAELSGNPSVNYYNDYIKFTPSRRQANIIRVKLIRESRKPWTTFASYKAVLTSTPDLYADALAFVYAKDNSNKLLQANIRPARNTELGRQLQTFLSIDADAELNKKITNHRISSRTQSTLKKTLNERLALLKQAERSAQSFTRSANFTMQVITLNRVARENMRIYNDLLKTPTPRGLNATQRQEYRQLLLAQIDGYKSTSERIRNEVDQLWNKSNYLRNLVRASELETTVLRNLHLKELRALSYFAPKPHDKTIVSAIQKRPPVPSKTTMAEAQTAVKADPFNLRKLATVRELAEKSGNTTMVAFVDSRVTQIEKRGVQ